MLIPATNPWERSGRYRKILALISVIDRAASSPRKGLHPVRDAARLAYLVSCWDDEHWAKAAICAGCKPPSLETRALVVEHLRERAKGAA